MPAERSEPTYLYTDDQVAAKSPLARIFLETRSRLNTIVTDADNYLVKRFYNIDHNTYLEGAIPAKYKELMGLVVSAGLRCDDCLPVPAKRGVYVEAEVEFDGNRGLKLPSGRHGLLPAPKRPSGGKVKPKAAPVK